MTAATSRERNCLWMAVSRKSKDPAYPRPPATCPRTRNRECGRRYRRPSSTLSSRSSKRTRSWIGSMSGKNLTTIYATHGHGDHFFGIGALLDRFPNARAVATSDVVKVMRQQTSPQSPASFLNPFFPRQISNHLLIAEELTENVIDLERHDLVVSRHCFVRILVPSLPSTWWASGSHHSLLSTSFSLSSSGLLLL
jgi:Metallo-beta-lactamase superfamily